MVFDIFDQAANTIVVNRAVEKALEARPRIANEFAPITPVQDDRISRERVAIRAVGKGSVIAPDATPPIYRPKFRFTQEFVDLVRLEEMTPIELSLLRKLEINGSDPESQRRRQKAGGDILTRARALQLRMENQSDYMVMQAITTGKLEVEMADEPGQLFELDYDFDPLHLPTAGTTWNNLTTATPITNMRAWQELLADDAGDIGVHFWMTSKIWRYIQLSTEAKDYLTGTDRPMYLPTQQDIKNLMEEPERVTFHVSDAGWLDEGAGYARGRKHLTKWLPENRVIVTTDPVHEGERIAEMYDGLTSIQTDWKTIRHVQGPQSDAWVQPGSKTTFWRQASMRIPMVHKPECIVSAQVTA